MGYSTDFDGTLEFTKEPTASQLATIKSYFGEDFRDHPEWGHDGYYIDLELSSDFLGIQWDGSEKTYDMIGTINFIIREMKKMDPDLGLTGSLHAQGEDFDDRYDIVIGDDGFAHKKEIIRTGTKVQCPHCEQHFYLDDE